MLFGGSTFASDTFASNISDEEAIEAATWYEIPEADTDEGLWIKLPVPGNKVRRAD